MNEGTYGLKINIANSERPDLKELKQNPEDYLLFRRGKLYLCAGVPGDPVGGSKMNSKGATYADHYKKKVSVCVYNYSLHG